ARELLGALHESRSDPLRLVLRLDPQALDGGNSRQGRSKRLIGFPPEEYVTDWRRAEPGDQRDGPAFLVELEPSRVEARMNGG
ncbi:MAG: hypothetical protein M3301_04440, partial [Chloroflexota bacterium]|nr:hypothetical protein [Chloroflexota bacterium]